MTDTLPAKRTLYEIAADMQALDELLDETAGDISNPDVEQAIDRWMADNSVAFENKVDGYVTLILECQRLSEVRKAEADRLAQRARIDAAKAHGLSIRLKAAFEHLGIRKVETTRARVAIVNCGGKQALDIQDEAAIPKQFMDVIPATTVVAKDKVRAALERGEDVPGAALLPRGTRLSIR